jgi:hypothetical protein
MINGRKSAKTGNTGGAAREVSDRKNLTSSD